MPSLELPKTEMGLFSDYQGTRIQIPHLISQERPHVYDMTKVRFEGDTSPTMFRGEGHNHVYNLTARYARDEQSEMYDLLHLFHLAFEDSDGRIILRTNSFIVAGLDGVEAVMVNNPTERPVAGGVWDVVFIAETVAWTPEV